VGEVGREYGPTSLADSYVHCVALYECGHFLPNVYGLVEERCDDEVSHKTFLVAQVDD
jgi:hypothetical protein